MAEKKAQNPRGARTLDLSTGKKGTTKRKTANGVGPVVQQTINLSTPKVEEVENPRPAMGRRNESQKSEKPDRRTSAGQGNRLADLLDPETLAKLKG